MFFSLLAASADGFICGFILRGLGIKIRLKEFLVSFGIIFLCCITAAITGKYMAYTKLEGYLNIIGVCILLWLAVSSLCADENYSYSSIYSASLAVAIDAAVACLYLSIMGYNILILTVVSAFLHCSLMAAANTISSRILTSYYAKYIRFTAGLFFILAAIVKLKNI